MRRGAVALTVIVLLAGVLPVARGVHADPRLTAIEYGSRADGHGAVLADGLDARNTASNVAVTSDGAVWFRESFAWHPRIARFGSDGSLREFWDPLVDFRPDHVQTNGWPGALVADGTGVLIGLLDRKAGPPRIRRMERDGSVRWVSASGCAAVAEQIAGAFACFASRRGDPEALARLPNANWVTRGPRGDLWFTDAYAGAIVRLSPDGRRTAFRRGLTRWNSGPQFITTGPDGNMWFTELRDRVGRITQDGRITEFSRGIPHRASLGGIVAGPDGNLWFTLYHGMVLGRITVNGRITLFHDLVYPSDGHDFDPVAVIVRDRLGRLYYNEGQAGRIARVTIR